MYQTFLIDMLIKNQCNLIDIFCRESNIFFYIKLFEIYRWRFLLSIYCWKETSICVRLVDEGVRVKR